VAPSKPSLLELAREARAAVAARPGTVLAAIALTSLAAVALHLLAPSYAARAEVTFTNAPASPARALPDPARVLTSGAVLSEIGRRLRQAGIRQSPDALEGDLTVLQPDGAGRAVLVARAPSKPRARLLASVWADSFLHVRQLQIGRALASSKRRLNRAIATAGGGRRRALRERLITLEALGTNLPGGALVDSPSVSSGSGLLPWKAPLAGLLLGIVLAAWLGLRAGRVRTRSLLTRLGGPQLLGVVARPRDGLGLAAARIASLGREHVVISPLAGPADAAAGLARAAGSEPVMAGVAVEPAPLEVARRQVGPRDAWLLAVPLGLLTRQQLERRFAELASGGRQPDGMLAQRVSRRSAST
jgi:hypothetical protein